MSHDEPELIQEAWKATHVISTPGPVLRSDLSWHWCDANSQTFWLDPHNQSFTLNQRAHLLSAELGITPKDALERLQGQS